MNRDAVAPDGQPIYDNLANCPRLRLATRDAVDPLELSRCGCLPLPAPPFSRRLDGPSRFGGEQFAFNLTHRGGVALKPNRVTVIAGADQQIGQRAKIGDDAGSQWR